MDYIFKKRFSYVKKYYKNKLENQILSNLNSLSFDKCFSYRHGNINSFILSYNSNHYQCNIEYCVSVNLFVKLKSIN